MTIALILCLLVLAAILWRARRFSFAAQVPASYAATGPRFDPHRVLNGRIESEGVIFGPTGRAMSRFVARMEGRWAGSTGTLTEHFQYDSGREQRREWRLTLHNDGRITGEADDVVGEAQGVLSGATLRLTYRLRLPADAGGHVLDVVDWLYLMPNGMLMNRSQMRRFGVTLVELVATMRPTEAAHG